MTTPRDPKHHLHAVRALTEQEAEDYMRVRAAFLREVIGDDRTTALFAMWAEQIHFGRMVAAITPVLDRAAARAGLDGRAAFRPRRDQSEASLVGAFEVEDERLLASCLRALAELMDLHPGAA